MSWTISARKHHGVTSESNVALSCIYCNAYKGSNLSGIDPVTGKLTKLFHPRKHQWNYHFRYDGGTLIGRTAIDLLRINLPNLVAIREVLIEDGAF